MLGFSYASASGRLGWNGSIFRDAVFNIRDVTSILDHVQVVGGDDQHRRLPGGILEEPVIGLVQFIDIAALHLAFVGAVAESNALHQHVGACLQVHHQVRFGDLFPQRLMHLFVHGQLIALQVDACKERILGEGVIGQQVFPLRKDVRDGVVLLAVAAQQEEDLRLERVALPVRVKIGQEGVFLEDLEQQFGFKAGLQHPGQRGLAHTDDPFDRNVHERLPGEMGQGYHSFKCPHRAIKYFS
jgi:hypothetical protein